MSSSDKNSNINRENIETTTAFTLDEDWEEYDASKGPFVVHMIAGSCAGVAEHGIVYPIDTMKTYLQIRYDNNNNNSAGRNALKNAISSQGLSRMYRGIFAVFAGVIPAHSAFFSVYEITKEKFGANLEGHHPFAAAASGACATMAHDLFMTPLDVVKQRLQLGCHNGVMDCARCIAKQEGSYAFIRSLPVTLLMNMPYSAVNVAVNESARKFISPNGEYNMNTFLLSGGIAGAISALVTTPLDVAKTRLQTQSIKVACENMYPLNNNNNNNNNGGGGGGKPPGGNSSGGGGGLRGLSKSAKKTLGKGFGNGNIVQPVFKNNNNKQKHAHMYSSSSGAVRYNGLFDTIVTVAKEEGPMALMRGSGVRMLAHAPALGVSWTAYELCKKLLLDNFNF